MPQSPEPTKSANTNVPAASFFGRFEDLQHEMNRVFDRFFHHDPFKSWGLPTRLKGFDLSPTVDVTERPESYDISVELPGVDEKDVKVTVENGVLSIAGEKKEEKIEDKKTSYVCERNYGSFERRFSLPDDADEARITAKFAKGVLGVSIGRSAKAKTNAKQIEVKAA